MNRISEVMNHIHAIFELREGFVKHIQSLSGSGAWCKLTYSGIWTSVGVIDRNCYRYKYWRLVHFLTIHSPSAMNQ